MNSQIIIITGAGGFIGSALVKHFAGRQYKVFALDIASPPDLPDGVEYLKYDLADRNINEDIFSKAGSLVHCAYLPYSDANKNADEINYEGAKYLNNIAKKYSLKKFVFLSSFSAHSKAISHYGKTKLLSESIFDLSTDLVLKPGLVLGNGGLFNAIKKILAKNKFIPLLGGGGQSVQTININELALVIQKGIEGNISGIFPIGEAKAITMKMLYSAISEKTGKKNIFIPFPCWCAELMIFAAKLVHIKIPVSKENIMGLKTTQKYDISEAEKVFGMRLMGYKESLELLNSFKE